MATTDPIPTDNSALGEKMQREESGTNQGSETSDPSYMSAEDEAMNPLDEDEDIIGEDAAGEADK